MKLWKMLGLGFLGVMLLGAVTSKPQPSSRVPSQDEVRAYLKYTVMEEVRSMLKDPSSAVFGPVWENGGVWCGTVNAKNSFGALTGMKPFVIAQGTIYLLQDGDSSGASYWRAYCS